MELLFVYGTLKSKEVQRKVIGREINSSKDALKGYKLTKTMINNEIYPAIIRDDKSKVYGELLKLDIEDLKKIDDYEGNDYDRTKILLESGLTAWVYVLHK